MNKGKQAIYKTQTEYSLYHNHKQYLNYLCKIMAICHFNWNDQKHETSNYFTKEFLLWISCTCIRFKNGKDLNLSPLFQTHLGLITNDVVMKVTYTCGFSMF